jgi:hypothetical protein
MASKSLKTRERKRPLEYWNLNSDSDIRKFTNTLTRICKVYLLPEEVTSKIANMLFWSLKSYTATYSAIKTDYGRAEFREASKRHQRTLNSILTFIVQSFKTEGLSTIVTFDNRIVTVQVNNMVVMREEVHPRSFHRWYRTLKLFTNIKELTTSQIVVITRILTTLFNVVNEIRLRKSEKDSETKKLISLLKGDIKFSLIDDFKSQSIKTEDPRIRSGIQDLKETVEILKFYCSNPSQNPPIWARDMVRALRLVILDSRLFVYDNTRPMLSLNSTCSSMKIGKKELTIPGVFASCIEPDYFLENYPESNFDSIVSFKQRYKIDLEDLIEEYSIKSQRRFSVSIDQKKPKPRVIHPLNNSEQDRLKYFHILIESVLTNVASDCTFDQSKGPSYIKSTMVQHPEWAIYSLDLTSATDTFNIGLQYIIIKDLILNNHPQSQQLADDWLNMMTSKTSIRIGDERIEFQFTNGQPQGFLSSFPAFALEHHLVMLTVLRKFSPGIPAEQFYRVLGDDSLIVSRDDKSEIPDLYIKYVNSANVECNISKGYLYNPSNPDRQVKIAEFAKHLILDGSELTPIPYKLITTSEDIVGNISLAAWLSDHSDNKWTIENLKYFLLLWDEWFSKYYSSIIDIMVRLTVPGIFFQSFRQKLDRLSGDFTEEDTSVIQFLLLNTLMYSVIDKIIGVKNIPEGIPGLIRVSHELHPFLKSISDKTKIDPNNKVSIVNQLMLSYYYTIKELCNRYSSLSDLDDETIELACMILQVSTSKILSRQLEEIFKAMNLLTLDPSKLSQSDRNTLTNDMLLAYRGFSISVDRNWSNFGRKIPIDFLQRSLEGVSDLLKRREHSVSEYILENDFGIDPEGIEPTGIMMTEGEFSLFGDLDIPDEYLEDVV